MLKIATLMICLVAQCMLSLMGLVTVGGIVSSMLSIGGALIILHALEQMFGGGH